ncbi:MAG: serine protease [Gemmataceae bacterium]
MMALRVTLLLTIAVSGLALALIDPAPAPKPSAGPRLYRDLLRGTAWVITPSKNKGTAWIVAAERRLLITNYHIVGDAQRVELFFPVRVDGQLMTERRYYLDQRDALRAERRCVQGKVMHRDPKRDLALIEAEALPDDAVALPLARGGAAAGETVHSVGQRGDGEALWVHARGVVRQVYDTPEGYFWQGMKLAKGARVVVTQSPILPGDSGGPMVNDRGEVVGVAAAVRWQTPLACVCIDVREVRHMLAQAGFEIDPAPPTPPAPAAGPEVYRQGLRSVALIQTATASTRATGWLVDRQRKWLLTCKHVVGPNATIEATFPVRRQGQVIVAYDYYKDHRTTLRERGHTVTGRVIATDERRNLALIELESVPPDVVPLPLAQTSPVPGEALHCIGNPNGIEAVWVYSAGVVRQLVPANLEQTKEKPDPLVVLAQLPLHSRDGGAPVLNDGGQLVALTSGRDAPQQLASYCLAVSEVRAFLRAVDNDP